MDERVFLIVRVTVQLSHPADMQLVLAQSAFVLMFTAGRWVPDAH